jgi:predicted RNase H-like HicB family nuclease
MDGEGIEKLVGEDEPVDLPIADLSQACHTLDTRGRRAVHPIPTEDPPTGSERRQHVFEEGPRAEAGLQEVRRPAERRVQPPEQPCRGPPEERRERRSRDVVPRFADRRIGPDVVPPLAVQRLLHEGGERDRAAGADAFADAAGGGGHGGVSLPRPPSPVRYDGVMPENTPLEMELTAVYRRVPEGYIAFVEELPGANTQGQTLEEARANLQEAVALVLEANRELAEEELAGKEVIRERFKLTA